jgi:predicted TIM-barrel fold metal-dependent hydrolase
MRQNAISLLGHTLDSKMLEDGLEYSSAMGKRWSLPRDSVMDKRLLVGGLILIILVAVISCAQTPTEPATPIPTPELAPVSKSELYQGIIVDAHAHFKSKAVNIEELIFFLDQADINKVVLFAGATALQNAFSKYPDRVIPFLNPFKRDSSTRKLIIPEDAPEKIEEHLKSGLFKGIGEITLRLHPLPGVAPEGDNHPADSPVMLEIYDIAAKYDVSVNVHVDLEYIDELERALEHNRKTTIIWAHCGYGDPSLIRGMMDRHSNLFADLSIILDPSKGKYSLLHRNPDGSISQEWKKLLEDYSDRLMFGTDMGMSKERYESTSEVTSYYRGLLYQLSPEAAENIAFKTILRILETTDENTTEEVTQEKSTPYP